MKTLLLLLLTGLPMLLRSFAQPGVTGSAPASAEQADRSTPVRAGVSIRPDAGHAGFFQVLLPARHGVLQVSVLDAQNRPVQPAQLMAAAAPLLLLDARQWPAGEYQVQLRSASEVISTRFQVP